MILEYLKREFKKTMQELRHNMFATMMMTGAVYYQTRYEMLLFNENVNDGFLRLIAIVLMVGGIICYLIERKED